MYQRSKKLHEAAMHQHDIRLSKPATLVLEIPCNHFEMIAHNIHGMPMLHWLEK
jgi:hypothetical protein